jgi:hypothetical protein
MREILVESRLWLSSPKDFNDPFDMSAKIIAEGNVEEKRERWLRILERRGKRWDEIQRELPDLVAQSDEKVALVAQQQQEDIAKRFGVCSFGGDPRSILMWSHYASNHEGFCLQFEVAKDLKAFGRLVRVKYRTGYPVINWVKEQEFYEGIAATLERKYKHWEYEREIRLIIPNAAGEYLTFQPDSLRAVIIGCRVAPTTTECMRQLINERISAGLAAPILYKAVKHYSKYKLVIRKMV